MPADSKKKKKKKKNNYPSWKERQKQIFTPFVQITPAGRDAYNDLYHVYGNDIVAIREEVNRMCIKRYYRGWHWKPGNVVAMWRD